VEAVDDGAAGTDSGIVVIDNDDEDVEAGPVRRRISVSKAAAAEPMPSTSTPAAIRRMVKSGALPLRRSPRKASKPNGWYSEEADFDDDY
jgi:hypothetical protein